MQVSSMIFFLCMLGFQDNLTMSLTVVEIDFLHGNYLLNSAGYFNPYSTPCSSGFQLRFTIFYDSKLSPCDWMSKLYSGLELEDN